MAQLAEYRQNLAVLAYRNYCLIAGIRTSIQRCRLHKIFDYFDCLCLPLSKKFRKINPFNIEKSTVTYRSLRLSFWATWWWWHCLYFTERWQTRKLV